MPPRQRSGKKSLDSFAQPDFSTKEASTPSSTLEQSVGVGGMINDSISTPGQFATSDQYRDDISSDHKSGSNKSLDDKGSANVTYAGTAFATFGLAVSAANAVKVFTESSDPKERAQAVRDLGLGAIGMAGSISSTVKTAQGGDNASAMTKMADGVLSEIAGIAGSMKEAWDLVVKIADVINTHDALEDAEKAVAGMDIVKSLLLTGKGVVDTINAFMRHLGTVSTGLVQAAPGIGIAINAMDMIINGFNIAHSYISMVEMRTDKRASKEKVLGRKANKSAGIRGFFGGHESAQDQAKATIGRLGGKSTLTDDETTELRTSEDYLLSKNLQRIGQKRINRGALNITANAVNIAGDIATLSGVGAAVGAGLKAGGTGITVGAAAVRTGKQWYHNAKGDSKSETAKLAMYDTMISHMVRAIVEANTFTVPAPADPETAEQTKARTTAEQTQTLMREKALRQVIASGMTPGKMNGYLPDAEAKLQKQAAKDPTVAVTPDAVSKNAGKALYADWVNALKKR
jgi:hypothetical protein